MFSVRSIFNRKPLFLSCKNQYISISQALNCYKLAFNFAVTIEDNTLAYKFECDAKLNYANWKQREKFNTFTPVSDGVLFMCRI